MDLQMKRHKWFPTDDGIDVCSVCAQPDLPEVGIFCPGPKPVVEPIPPGPYVEPRFDPKPATPEAPEWKRCKQFEMMGFHVRRGESAETCLFCGRSEIVIAAAGESMKTGVSGAVFRPDPVVAFTARRKAKREQWGDDRGQVVLDFISARAADLLFFGEVTTEVFDLADDAHAEDPALSRAMQAPVTFTARLGMKT